MLLVDYNYPIGIVPGLRLALGCFCLYLFSCLYPLTVQAHCPGYTPQLSGVVGLLMREKSVVTNWTFKIPLWFGAGRYRDTNPVTTSLLTDDLATALSRVGVGCCFCFNLGFFGGHFCVIYFCFFGGEGVVCVVFAIAVNEILP